MLSRLFFAILYPLIHGATLTAQVQAPIPASHHPSVVIARLEDEKASVPNIVATHQSQPLFANAFVVRNTEKRDIIGLVGIWTITDQDGLTNTSTFTSDIFFSIAPDSVLRSGQAMVLSPNGWLNPSMHRSPTGGGLDIGGGGRGPLVSERVGRAKAVAVSIDSIIFKDGEMCGPNKAQLDGEVYSKYKGPRAIASVVRAAMESKEDWRSQLDKYRDLTNASLPYQEPFWSKQFAATILGPPGDVEELLTFYESLPDPPPFHACVTSK